MEKVKLFCQYLRVGLRMLELIKYNKVANLTKKFKKVEILWASFRETFNIFQSERSGCHIITIEHSKFDKLL